jgi:hypothetical protein
MINFVVGRIPLKESEKVCADKQSHLYCLICALRVETPPVKKASLKESFAILPNKTILVGSI